MTGNIFVLTLVCFCLTLIALTVIGGSRAHDSDRGNLTVHRATKPKGNSAAPKRIKPTCNSTADKAIEALVKIFSNIFG